MDEKTIDRHSKSLTTDTLKFIEQILYKHNRGIVEALVEDRLSLKALSARSAAFPVAEAMRKLKGLSMHLREGDCRYEDPRVMEGLLAVADEIDEIAEILKGDD